MIICENELDGFDENYSIKIILLTIEIDNFICPFGEKFRIDKMMQILNDKIKTTPYDFQN